MKTTYRALCVLASAGCLNLVGCGGGGSPDRVQITQGNAAAEALAEVQKKAEEAAAKEEVLKAPIRAGEFSLTITPGADAKSAFAIPVHVLSVNKAQVPQYMALGADRYWDSPSGAAKSFIFGTSGSSGPVSMAVPTRSGADTILIIAKLPAAGGGGGDARIMEVPLERQAGADPLKPETPPISVRLSRIGVLPN